MRTAPSPRELPDLLAPLTELALDLRWTWSHGADALWARLDADTWRRTRNPWIALQDVPGPTLRALAADPAFVRELEAVAHSRQEHLGENTWFAQTHNGRPLRVAYFSMEFGLGAALPLYAGGLGVLAGDYLKSASDLGIPLVGVGLLYQEGYFRQILDDSGAQHESYPYNDPTSLPIRPVTDASGSWVHVPLHLPGRTAMLRVWRANVGRVPLFLLDSNDPVNHPIDRGITSKLYASEPEVRAMQALALGIGGYRLLDTLDLPADICHLNEGHAAFLVLERARQFMRRHGTTFHEALWATRAGNVFTTHTSVAAAFDTISPAQIRRYFPYFRNFLAEVGLSPEELLALGRRDPRDGAEPFNLTYLAMRGSAFVNGVSRLHGRVSRKLFACLFPRWPEAEVPVTHVTNGVHVPSWDSVWSDAIWTRVCGKERWRGSTEQLRDAIEAIPDEDIWSFCTRERHDLIEFARGRLTQQRSIHGAEDPAVAAAGRALDPDVLTLGYARRFTAYKRPDLLLRDPERLARLLTHPERPVQLVVAGKAHPADEEGKRLVADWARFARRPDVARRAVFLEDYDIMLAEILIGGVDVWVNTPRRPWEACGTSGMKVLVNGGLNVSTLDGWWDEAYAPEFGWAIGGREEPAVSCLGELPDSRRDAAIDARDAEALYRVLEEQVVPEFYQRDAQGVPRAWVARIRRTMAALAPDYSGNRMVRECLERAYLPAAARVAARQAGQAAISRTLGAWETRVRASWSQLRIGPPVVALDGDAWAISVRVHLGRLAASDVRVEAFADEPGGVPLARALTCEGPAVGEDATYEYRGRVAADRPEDHYTVRVVAFHPEAVLPLELPLIAWQR